MQKVFVYDPTASDPQSKVRGVGRYLQILRENFKEWIFTDEIKRTPADAMLINPFFNLIQPPTIKGRVAKRQIAVIHDLIPLKYPEHFPIGARGFLNVTANRLQLRHYDVIITDSEASKKDIVTKLKVKSDKVKVIYPCLPRIFENSKIENSLKIDSPAGELKIENYFLYVGDATWNKNLVNFTLAIKNADVACVFVGKVFQSKNSSSSPTHPWQKELREFLTITEGDPRFILLGFVPDEQLVGLYKNALANILVSRDEGFGFSYLEAASQSTPSILSDIPVLHEIAKDTALFASPENAGDIAQQIKTISSRRTTLGKKAKARTKAFSPISFKKSFLEIK